MPLTFRSARREDVAAIAGLYDAPHVAGNLHVPSPQRIGEWIADERCRSFVVATERGDVEAFALAVVHDSWLVEIAHVVARTQGAGLGWFATREAVRYAFESLRAHRVYLEVVASNARARRVYERAGFALEGTWRDGYRREDGTYADLCAYGRLDTDRAAGAA